MNMQLKDLSYKLHFYSLKVSILIQQNDYFYVRTTYTHTLQIIIIVRGSHYFLYKIGKVIITNERKVKSPCRNTT